MSARFLSLALAYFASVQISHGYIKFANVVNTAPANPAKFNPHQYTCTAEVETLGITPSYNTSLVSGKLTQQATDSNTWGGYNAVTTGLRAYFRTDGSPGYKRPGDCDAACQWCFNQAAGMGAVTAYCQHFPDANIEDAKAVRCYSTFDAFDQYLQFMMLKEPDSSTGIVINDVGTGTRASCTIGLDTSTAGIRQANCTGSTFSLSAYVIVGAVAYFNVSHLVTQPDGSVFQKTAIFDYQNYIGPITSFIKIGFHFVTAAAPGIQGDALIYFPKGPSEDAPRGWLII